MSRNKIFIIVIIVLLLTAFLSIVKYTVNGNGTLVSPGVRKVLSLSAAAPVVTVTPTLQAASYNPPKELKYDSATDLKRELESINPIVLDSDFE